jgi:hypothetical protein
LGEHGARNASATEAVSRFTTPYGRSEKETRNVMNKTKIALWALRNRRTRELIIKGLKNRRVRNAALNVAKRRIGR